MSMTYEQHIEIVAERVQRVLLAHRWKQSGGRDDFAAVGVTCEEYMGALDDAEAFCDWQGIPRAQLDRDLNARLGLF